MAAGAQSNQVQIVIRALPATQPFVMDLQVLLRTASLTSPGIAPQYLQSELFVLFGIELHTRLLSPIGFTRPSRSLRTRRSAVARQAEICRTMTWTVRAPLEAQGPWPPLNFIWVASSTMLTYNFRAAGYADRGTPHRTQPLERTPTCMRPVHFGVSLWTALVRSMSMRPGNNELLRIRPTQLGTEQ
jgi:hypothetical protein